MITIIDYGAGNLNAFIAAYDSMGIQTTVARCRNDLRSARKIIFPGVGAFDSAMRKLNISGLKEPLTDMVSGGEVQFLGICVGMQLLASCSQEGSDVGLGWIPGEVKAFNSIPGLAGLRQPHIGWNTVSLKKDNSLFNGLDTNSRFYFLHSYIIEPEDKSCVIATTTYGCEFPSIVRKGNIFGIQFHPEKSHDSGYLMLKNFAINGGLCS